MPPRRTKRHPNADHLVSMHGQTTLTQKHAEKRNVLDFQGKQLQAEN